MVLMKAFVPFARKASEKKDVFSRDELFPGAPLRNGAALLKQ